MVTNAQGDSGRGPGQIVFYATNGTTYHIAVDGFGPSPINQGNFTLSWNQPFAAVILRQPETTNVVANANENGTFSVLAIGNPSPSIQWRHEGTNVPNATNASHTITNVQFTHATNYTVVASNGAGSVTSAIASLIVHADSAARLSLWNFTSNEFRMHISGLTSRGYVVESSTNLNAASNWHATFTNFVSFWYTNFVPTNDYRRFYRVITN